MFRIKICGITRPQDAAMAARAGADAIGINFYAGSKRCVELETAKSIAAAVPNAVAKVGVFVNASADEIRQLAAEVPLDYVQLHGDEPPEILAELSALRVVKAIRISQRSLVPVTNFIASCESAPNLHAVLLDAYSSTEYGGTGKKLDWTFLGHDLKLPSRIALIVAGGLNAGNIASAIKFAHPWAVDTASGVESSPGVKDAAKVEAFVRNATEAFGCG